MFAAPAPYPVPEPVVAECVSTASRTYAVPELVIRTILKVEGGKVGTMSRNTNGSYDLGPMQINTINLSLINKEYPFLNWKHITYNPCINIMVGTWFLSAKIRARKGVIWEGVGDYHSVTPSKRRVYLDRFLAHYTKLKKQYGFKPVKGGYTQSLQTVDPQLTTQQPVVSKQDNIPKLLSRQMPKDNGNVPTFAALLQLRPQSVHLRHVSN